MNTINKSLSVFLSALLCFSLLVFPASAENALPESAHPYENGCDLTWEYTYPGEVNGFFITFSPDTRLEEGSWLFADAAGNEVRYTMEEINALYDADA